MQHLTSENCRTCADAALLLDHAKLHVLRAATPRYQRGHYDALRLLSMAQRDVFAQWSADAPDLVDDLAER